MKDYNEYMVVLFSMNEPTSDLSEYCFRKLGFDNIVILNDQSSFVDKFVKFSEIVNDTNYEYYIRSDSDRFVFEGMFDMIDLIGDNAHVQGWGFDYFMNKFWAATPQIYHRELLLLLFNDNSLIRNVPKPENYFCGNLQMKTETIKAFTNLHDYYQKPSKVCNTFLNRMIRDGLTHYNMKHIGKLPDLYQEAFDVAIDHHKRKEFTVDMNYKNFDFLDDSFLGCDNIEIDELYKNAKSIYDYHEPFFSELSL